MDIVTYALLNKKLTTKADLVDGKIPADELPSYVDDVVEYSSRNAFPTTGEAGKIYVALDTGYTYRWSGSTYTQIGGQDLSDYYTKSQTYSKTEVNSALAEKQATLVSGTNIKTINSVSLLGSGNVEISGSTFIVTDVIIDE